MPIKKIKNYRRKPLIGSKVNWGHPLSKRLVCCYLFNEGRGNKVYDIARKNHGTIQGTPSWQNGIDGKCLSIPTLNDYVEIPYTKSLTDDPRAEKYTDMESLPSADGWTFAGNNEGTHCSVAGGILTVDTIGATTDYAFYRINTTYFDNAEGWTVEASIKVISIEGSKAEQSILFVRDGSYSCDVEIYNDQVKLRYESVTYDMDTTDDYHTYRIVVKGTLVKVYIDGALRLTGTLSHVAYTKEILIGDGAGDDGQNCNVKYNYVWFVSKPYHPNCNWTFDFYIRNEIIDVDRSLMFKKGLTSTTPDYFFRIDDSQNALALYYASDIIHTPTLSPYLSVDSIGWYRITIVVKGNSNTIDTYKNGLYVGSVAQTFNPQFRNSGDSILIGGDLGAIAGATGALQGKISTFYMWNRSLSAKEISEINNNPYSFIESTKRSFFDLLEIDYVRKLERGKNRKPYMKILFAWGGNLTRYRNGAGSLVSSITSSSEFSADFPDDRAIDGRRPHKDPTDSTWNGYWKSSGIPSLGSPEWLKIDLGSSKIVNRINLYHYYDTDKVLSKFELLSSDDDSTYTSRYYSATNNLNKTTIILPADITARYWKLNVYLTKDDNEAIVQEIELYNYVDESKRVLGQDIGAPEVIITQRSNSDINSLPEPIEWTVVLSNIDKRFTPLNEDSDVYGTKQADSLGDIRAGVPVIIYGGFYDTQGILKTVEIVSGQIGTGFYQEGSSGIQLSSDGRTVTITGKDTLYILRLTQMPNGVPVYESYTVENLLLELCYIAGIPYQDTNFEATGITINYAIFSQSDIYTEMEEIRKGSNGKLFSVMGRDLKFITTDPNRSHVDTEQGDWDTGTTKNQVDTAVSVGDVLVTKTAEAVEEQWAGSGTDFANIGGSWRHAQSFQVSNHTEYLTKIDLNLKKPLSGITGDIHLQLQTDSGGSPSGTVLAQYTIDAYSLLTSWSQISFVFTTPLAISKDTTYWIVLSYPSGTPPGGWYIQWKVGSAGYSKGVEKYNTGSGWILSIYDADFKVYTNYYYDTGYLISNEIDFGATISQWGVFAPATSIPSGSALTYKLFMYDSPGTAWDEAQAVTITAGGTIIAPVKRYGKYKVYFTTNYLTTPVLQEIIIYWQVTSAIIIPNYYLFTEDDDLEILSINIGNPDANHAIVKSNPYVLQALTSDVWILNETITIADTESKTVYAFYSYPSIKDSGGNIRHIHITISAVGGTCNDDSSATINGCNVEFDSGANVGVIVITNNSGSSKSVTAISVDARELWDSVKANRKLQTESEDTTSINIYGRKFTKEIDNKYIATLVNAQSIADAIVSAGKYVKIFFSSAKVQMYPSITLQDILSMTNANLSIGARQSNPLELSFDGKDFSMTIQSKEV